MSEAEPVQEITLTCKECGYSWTMRNAQDSEAWFRGAPKKVAHWLFTEVIHRAVDCPAKNGKTTISE